MFLFVYVQRANYTSCTTDAFKESMTFFLGDLYAIL